MCGGEVEPSDRLGAYACRVVEKSASSKRVVVLNGPAGVGKTRIGRLLAGRAENGVCIHGDSLADFIVSRVPGTVEPGLGYANGALLAASYIQAGYDLVVFEYCFEHPRHVRRFIDAYHGSAPASVFTLWAPLKVVQERELVRTGRRRLGARVEECYRSMEANLAELGETVQNDGSPEEIAERIDHLSATAAMAGSQRLEG